MYKNPQLNNCFFLEKRLTCLKLLIYYFSATGYYSANDTELCLVQSHWLSLLMTLLSHSLSLVVDTANDSLLLCDRSD